MVITIFLSVGQANLIYCFGSVTYLICMWEVIIHVLRISH